jgi:hypothetical protein
LTMVAPNGAVAARREAVDTEEGEEEDDERVAPNEAVGVAR